MVERIGGRFCEKGGKVSENQIAKIVENRVREIMTTDSVHDFWHVVRVRALAKNIAKTEDADEFLVDMIALFHDVFDPKINPVDNEENAILEMMNKLKIREELGEDFAKIIAHDAANLGWRGGKNNKKLSKEGKIAQDSDRLDAIGAIGIARVFAFSGSKNREIYNPEEKIRENVSVEEYINPNRKDSSIQHFYEKLLKLKDTLNTGAAREIAKNRHEFMLKYLDEFFAEWRGEK